jgi:hypothetical protein
MANEPLSTTVIEKSTTRIALSICVLTLIAIVTGLFTFLIGAFTIFPWAPRPIRSALDQPNLFPLLAGILLVIGQIGLLVMMVRFLFNQQPGLILDHHGITYWVSIFKVETLPWTAVDRIELSQNRFDKGLIGKFNPNICRTLSLYTHRDFPTATMIGRFNRWSGLGDKIIMVPHLKKSKVQVFDLLQTYLTASKSEINS